MVLPVQVIVGVAALVFVVLAAALFVEVHGMRKSIDRMAAKVEPLAEEARSLVQEMRDQVQRIRVVSEDVAQEVAAAVGTVRGWTDRANVVVDEIERTVVPPVQEISRAVNQVRVGVSAFLHAFHWGRHRGHDGNGSGIEADSPVTDRFASRRGEGS
jgi:uncharacterized protein YoxC